MSTVQKSTAHRESRSRAGEGRTGNFRKSQWSSNAQGERFNSQHREGSFRGRGRGRGAGTRGAGRGHTSFGQEEQEKANNQRKTASKSVLAKAEAIKKSSLAYLDKATESVESSDEEEEERKKEKELLEKTLRKYYLSLASNTGSSIEESQDQLKSHEFLSGSLLAASTTCLICICSIRRNHAVWSCVKCYCLFHLQCIHKWVVEGVQRKSLLSPQLFPDQEQTWSCPKCRGEYLQSQCPQKYQCYCGKVEDPPVDPWLLPHSCGDSCDKPLLPECGHRCLSLCHPGPCPPCPKNVSVKCHCGRSPPTMRRCGSKGWSCGRTCRKPLECGQHICEEKCHEGSCPKCTYTLEQACQCGRVTKERPCIDMDWSCNQVCKKMFSCNHHRCERICHSGDCGECPRSGERGCPCGKTKHVLPCTKDVPTCGDTCGKPLSCGIHSCMRTCHHGNCGQCLEQVVKKCRCGSKSKSLNCGTEFLCEVKCTNTKRCGRHQCKRKCCDGKCPPCELQCGKQLQCGRHKCSAPCHTGRCYPCVLMTTLSCSCGKTKIQISCEQRQCTRPPKCRELCTNPPSCHHPTRTPHLCHSKACPPCEQPCGRSLECGHTCPVPCHSEPKHRPKEDAPMDATIPWAQMKTILQEYSEQVIIIPCPPCMALVPKACEGGHEVNNFPCSLVRDYVCGRVCGRRLACGNHVCQNGCHRVADAPNELESGSNCTSCDLLCQRPRPEGCTHKCHLPCHPEECPKCEIFLRFRCHCTTMPLFIKCHEWTKADKSQKLAMQACNSQCIKILSCGHRCTFSCHPGDCSSTSDCVEVLPLQCPCRRIKKQVKCNKKVIEKPVCDEECKRVQEEKRKEQERRKAEEAAEAERKQKEEREAFQKQLEARQRRKRRRKERVTEEEDQAGFLIKHKNVIILCGVSVFALLVAMAAWYISHTSN